MTTDGSWCLYCASCVRERECVYECVWVRGEKTGDDRSTTSLKVVCVYLRVVCLCRSESERLDLKESRIKANGWSRVEWDGVNCSCLYDSLWLVFNGKRRLKGKEKEWWTMMGRVAAEHNTNSQMEMENVALDLCQSQRSFRARFVCSDRGVLLLPSSLNSHMH